MEPNNETDLLWDEIKLMVLKWFKDLLATLLKGVKILIVYIIPSAIVAALVTPSLSSWIGVKLGVPEVTGGINFFLITIAELIKKQLPNNKVANTVL